jgi:hypothetical protein
MSINNRERINNIYNNSKEPWHDLWKFAAEANGPKEKEERFQALFTWARERGKKARRKKMFKKAGAFVHAKVKYRKKARYFEKKNDKNAEQEAQKPENGLIYWSGKPVAAWIGPWLVKSVAHGWDGYVMSGYRTPAYSISLCFGICGAPSCPGRCAGASSGHSQKVYPGGCIDVTDYFNFADIQREIGSPLRNDLPADRPHFSTTGH